MNTLLYKNISLTLYPRKGWCFCGVWEMGRETYTQREDFFFPYLLSGARRCQRLHPFVSRDTSGWLCILRSTAILSTLSKSDCMVLITWSPSGYTPVVLDCLIVLSYPCLLITAWQLVKTHGVTRNEPKIHVICYITVGNMHQLIRSTFSEKSARYKYNQGHSYYARQKGVGT